MKKNYTSSLLCILLAFVTSFSFGLNNSKTDDLYVLNNFQRVATHYGLDVSEFTSSRLVFLNNNQTEQNNSKVEGLFKDWVNYKVYSGFTETSSALQSIDPQYSFPDFVRLKRELEFSNIRLANSLNSKNSAVSSNSQLNLRAITSCPGDFTVSVDAGTCGRTNVTFAIPTTNTPGYEMELITPLGYGDDFPIGDTVVSYQEQDINDILPPEDTCSFTVTVEDNEPPAITCPTPLASYDTDNNQCDATLSFVATATDNCTGTPAITYAIGVNAITFPYDFPIGSTTVTATADDGNGQTSSCDFDVLVEDNQAPDITCPAPLASYNTDNDQCDATLSFVATATDNCTGSPAITYAIGATAITFPYDFPIGSTTVTATADDGNGQTSSCNFDVLVEDNQAPDMTCPTPLASYDTDNNQCDATLSFVATATDNCTGSPAITYAIGATAITFPYDFPIGSTTVTATAEDGNGQTSSCNFDVLVEDNQAPAITCPAPLASYDTDNNQCDATLSFVATATDNCTGSPAITYAIGATAITFPYDFPIGSTTVTATADDGNGQTSSCNFDVLVEDNQPPATFCQDIPVQLDAAGNASIAAADIDNGSSDSCSAVTLSASQTAFTCADIGSNNVTLTVTDADGNEDICVATVTVQPYTTSATVSYTIAENKTTVCDYETLNFTAQPLGVGSDPVAYEWFVNGATTNITGLNFSYNSWTAPNDVVKVVMTVGSGSCAPKKEYEIPIAVNAAKPVSFSIAGPASICEGADATFNITSAINVGANPTYQWKLNNNNVGTNASSVTLSTLTGLTLAGPNVVTLEVISNATCATPSGLVTSSNNIAVMVNPNSTIDDPTNKNTTLCIDTSLVSSPNGNIVFSIGGGATSASVSGALPPGVSGSISGNSFTISGTPTASGTFNYTVNTSGGGCTQASRSGTLTVTPDATISKNVADSNIQTVCSGQNIAPIRYNIGGSATAANVSGLPAGITGNLNSGVFTISGAETVATSTTYNFTVTATGNCAPSSLTGSITINPNLTPTIAISATKTTICAGESVTFNITSQSNGGTNPTYQWQINNVNVSGANNNFFTTTALNNGNTVRVIMTSNETCVTSATATSSNIPITVNANLTPTVSILSNDADSTICPGTSVLFTATPVNGGSAPLYQWKINGSNVGGNTTTNTFSTTALTNGQTVTVVMTSNEACLATNNVTSNPLPFTVLPTLTPSVTIVSNDSDNNVCQGASVTFTATPTNGGSNPLYQWKINGADVGGNTSTNTFTTSALPTGAVVSVVMTSNYQCTTSATATSNTFTHTRYTSLTAPAISGPSSACPSANIITYSVPTNSNVLTYNWTVPSGMVINSGQGTNSIGVKVNTVGANNASITVQLSNPCNAVNASLVMNTGNSASVDAGPDQYICVGDRYVQLNMSIDGIVVKKKGDFKVTSDYSGGVLPSIGGQNVDDLLKGEYDLGTNPNPPSVITLTITTTGNVSGCTGTLTDEMKIFIRPNPTATISGTTSVCTGTGTNITFNGTPNTIVTYTKNSTTQTVNLGAAGSAVVATGNLTATTTYALVNVGYSNPKACTQNLTGSAVVTVKPNSTLTPSGSNNRTLCVNTTLVSNISFALGGGATNAEFTGLPTGMSGGVSGTNYIISGEPNEIGTFNYTVTTTTGNNCLQAQQTGTIIVNPDASITPPASTDRTLCVNTNLTDIVFTVGGSATGATVSGLPAGVSFNYNASGKTVTISGTPTTTVNSPFNYTVTATGTCAPATSTGIITVTPNAAINTSANLNPSLCIGDTITAMVFTISGGATSASATNLPPGLSLADTGSNTYSITGTATTSGIYNYTVNTAGTCAQASKSGTITVTGNATISNPGNKDQIRCINSSIANISFVIGGTATGAMVTGLPAGVNGVLNGTAFQLTGTPTVAGTFDYVVTTTGPCGNVQQTGQLIIDPNDTIIAPAIVDETVCLGNPIADLTFTIGGGATNASVSGLPSGVNGNLIGNDFVITGQPTQAGTFNYTVTTEGVCASSATGGVLTIKNAVSIGTQPANIGVCVTEPASISVGASGDNLTYQWYKGTPGSGTAVTNDPPQITGATSNTLSFANTSIANADDYFVIVSGNAVCGSGVPSEVAQLTVNRDIDITVQPQSITDCVNNTVTFTVEATGTIGSYQWKKGGVNFNGGIASSTTLGNTTTFTLELQNIATGDAGNYSLQLISNGGTCPEANTTSVALIVTEKPTATISYTGSPFCSDAGTQTVTLEGTHAYTGGTYAAAATSGGPNLDLNANGNFDPSNSDPGTYTISYTIPASGGCPSDDTVTTSITINALPEITTFTYAKATYCKTDVSTYTPNVLEVNNGIGGTYSASAGLTINSSTGAFSPNGLTPNTYTITYTATNPVGCSTVVSKSFMVTIEAEPDASFSYAATSYCSNGSNPTPTVTQSDGEFTASPSGLSINASTGAINLSASTPNSYTVNYTFAAVSGSCAQVQESQTVNITPLPIASIAYSSAAYCKSDTTPYTVTLNGSNNSGGTYSSVPAGLSINSAGTIVPSSSNVGNYTVSYTIPASGGCPQVVAQTTVKIDPLPVATFVYNASEYCKSGANPIISYTGGGVAGNFTASPAGLSLTASTGAINLAASTAGPYTITNTIAGGGTSGCADVTATFNIYIEQSITGGAILLGNADDDNDDGSSSDDTDTDTNQIVACHQGNGTLYLPAGTNPAHVVEWEYSANNGPWLSLGNANSLTYAFTGLDGLTAYRVKMDGDISSAACGPVYSAYAFVSVIPYDLKPQPVTVSASEFCLGGTSQFSSTIDFGGDTLNDGGDFQSGQLNPNDPDSWLIDGRVRGWTASGNNTSANNWSGSNGKTFNGTPYNSGQPKFGITFGFGITNQSNEPPYYWNNPYDNNPNTVLATAIETPRFSLLGIQNPTFEFDEAYQLINGGAAIIEISLDGGATYIQIPDNLINGNDRTSSILQSNGTTSIQSGNYGNFGDGTNHTIVDLSPYFGNTDVRIRLTMVRQANSIWAVDNFALPNNNGQGEVQWTDQFNHVIDPITGTTDILVTPVTPGNQTYTVTSYINGCRSVAPAGSVDVQLRVLYANAGYGAIVDASECGSELRLNAYDNSKTPLQNYIDLNNAGVWDNANPLFPIIDDNNDGVWDTATQDDLDKHNPSANIYTYTNLTTANFLPVGKYRDYGTINTTQFWTIASGPAGFDVALANQNLGNYFSNVNDPKAEFFGPGGVYTLQWNIQGSGAIACSSPVSVTLSSCATLDFDGIDDNVTFRNDFNQNSGPFSIEVWVKPDATNQLGGPNNSIQTILSKRDGNSLTTGYDLSLVNNKIWFSWNNGLSFTHSNTLSTNKWYHVAVTYDGTNNYKMYIDGIDLGSGTGAAPLINNFECIMGAMDRAAAGGNPNPINYYSGWLDELRIWSTALSVEQIRQMMNQEIQTSTVTPGNVQGSVVPLDIPGLTWTNLRGYYKMNQTTDIVGGYIIPNKGTRNGQMRNTETWQLENSPLPYTTKQNGNWDNLTAATPWSFGDTVWNAPNSLGIDGATWIDWNIVRTNHTIVSDQRDLTLLGLLVDSQQLNITGTGAQNETNLGTGLWVTRYLKIDGKIDLVGESQLVQKGHISLNPNMESFFDSASAGTIERDQQATGNRFNYNYLSALVAPQNASVTSANVSTNTYAIGSILRDGTTSATPGNITWTGGLNGSPTAPFTLSNRWLYTYANVSNTYLNWAPVGITTPIKIGFGFSMKGSGRDTAFDGTTQNYVFVGKPNNGTISNVIAGGNDALLGNPYPSAIDANAFILDNSSSLETGALYFWEHDQGNNSHILREYVGGYATYNLVGGGLAATTPPPITVDGYVIAGSNGIRKPERYVPVGQGFFVSSNSSGGPVVFKNSQRIFKREAVTLAVNDGSLFFRTANATAGTSPNTDSDVIKRVRLTFKTPEGAVRPLLLGFTSNNAATDGVDYGYDAPNNDEFPSDMSWMIEGSRYVIQGVGAFENTKQYPFAMKLAKNGEIKIALTDLENFDETIDVFVYDSLLGTYQQINSTDFTMTLDAGIYDNRFFLTFIDNNALSIDEIKNQNVLVNYLQNTDEIYIKTHPSVQVKQIYLINLLGQTVKSWNMTNTPMSDEIRIPAKNLSEGTYVVKVETDGATVNKKIIIKY